MNREQKIDCLKQHILQLLNQEPEGKLTRTKLCNKLGPDLSNDLYRKAEQALVGDKKIEILRGRKGGICLLSEADSQKQVGPESSTSDAEEPSGQEKRRTNEVQCYEPVLKQIEKHWTTQPGCGAVFGAVTAHQGARVTGGRWTRPDIILCTVSEWLFSSCPEGEVRTIEIKRFESLDILGVYEALSHKSCSHYSYLMIVDFPEELSSERESDFDRIMATAASHGIGVIKVPDHNDFDTWEFLLKPTRSDSDHQEIHNFLLNQFPPDKRKEFQEKVRQPLSYQPDADI